MSKQVKDIEPATMPLWPDAGKLLGLGRGATYLAAQRGDIDVIRIGGRILALRKPLHKKLRIEDDASPSAA